MSKTERTYTDLEQTFIEAFWSRVDKSAGPNGCWLWTAYCFPSGYGSFSHKGETDLVHRIAYRLCVGPIPQDYTIDHVKNRGCTHKNCVNPAHLEAVTRGVNSLRGDGPPAQNARKTHCIRGHEFTPDNLDQDKTGRRICKECQRLKRPAHQTDPAERERLLALQRVRVARSRAKQREMVTA